MNSFIWLDKITATSYICDEIWLQKVKAQAAAFIQVELQRAQSISVAVKYVAQFWRETYYRQLFPLRFGCTQDQQGYFAAGQPFGADAEVTLSGERPLRQGFLDGSGWPPIWPDSDRGLNGWLMADRLLIEAALLNVLLQQSQPDNGEIRHAARLAALTYPLQPLLENTRWLDGQVQQISALLATASKAEENILTRVTRVMSVLTNKADLSIAQSEIGLVLVAGQRIKQYVFDTPGLNEIRGGSTMLDNVTEDLTDLVYQEIGPEAIIRAGGSTLLFLAPADDSLELWPPRLRRAFFAKTKIAFSAAACSRVPIAALLNHDSGTNNFNMAVGQLFQAMSDDRAEARLSRHVTYPFETRCTLCQVRAAYDWDPDPEGNQQPLCEVCQIKRKSGRHERRDKILDVLVDLKITDRDHPDVELKLLGVQGTTRKEWLADDLGDLAHQQARRKLIGVVYGDGNNFGTVQRNMNDLALNRQWAARVENTTRAALALALGRATQKAAKAYGWQPGGQPVLDHLPFQVLARGGDDLSLFAWGPVAVHFANEFVQLTDLELQVTQQDADEPRPDLSYALGVLLTDEKTPVRKSVAFVEEELLKWAKQAGKERKLTSGAITMLYAEKADKVPADLDRYREEMYLLGFGRQFQLCATLRPYTAAELTALLTVAEKVRAQGHLGRLQRLIGAFYGARHGAFAGMLHYAYQKGRFKDGGWVAEVERALAEAMQVHVPTTTSVLLIDYSTAAPRTPFGLAPFSPMDGGSPPIVRFSPLWDLLELAKLLS